VLDSGERTLAAGEQLTVVPGAWHRWWNAGQDEVQVRVRIEPAMRFEEAILVLWGLCTDGHTKAEGAPRRCSVRCLPPAFAGSSAFGGRPMPFKGSRSRRSPRSRGYGAWSAQSIATSLSGRTPPPNRGSVASRSR
jgi:hypothetical protein